MCLNHFFYFKVLINDQIIIGYHFGTQELKAPLTYCCDLYVVWYLFVARPSVRNFFPF